jgi:hypothetical protein
MKFLLVGLQLSCVLLAQGSVRPAWIDVLPSQPGRVYAVGVATLTGNQAQSLQQAGQHARVELVVQLRASVKGTTTVQSSSSVQRQLGGPTTARSQQQLSEDSRISAQATDLPGLTVAETWVDAPGHTVYALAFMDVGRAILELQARLDDIRKDLEASADGADESAARTIQRLKKGRAELAKLEILADPLIAGGGSPMVRSDIRDARQALEQRLAQVRRSMTLGLRDGGSGIPVDLATVVRNAALKQGLGWTEGKGQFTIGVRLLDGAGKANAGRDWWDLTPSPDFTVAKAALELTITGRDGVPYQAVPIEATGLGTSGLEAGRGLVTDCQKKLEKLFDKWLDDLAL